MELSTILSALSEEGQEKTASEETAVKEASASKLDAALEAALQETAVEKTASETQATPQEDLTKIASRLASAEQEALIKEAELYGAALCDGFMARMETYESAAPASVKTAGVTEGDFTKFASENPELVKQAMELGYRETQQKLAAVAEQAYTDGYEKTAEAIKTAAEDCAVAGYKHANQILAGL